MSKKKRIFQLNKEFAFVVPYPIEDCFLNLENYNENRKFWYTALTRPAIDVERIKFRQAYEILIRRTAKITLVQLDADMECDNEDASIITGQVKVMPFAVMLLLLAVGLGLLANIAFPTEIIWWLRFMSLVIPILGLWYIQFQRDKLILALQDALLLYKKKRA